MANQHGHAKRAKNPRTTFEFGVQPLLYGKSDSLALVLPYAAFIFAQQILARIVHDKERSSLPERRSRAMLLQKFSECIATSSAEAEEKVDSNSRGSTFELLRKEKHIVFAVNVALVGDVTLVSAGCNVPCRLRWVPAAFMRQTFQIRGSSNFIFESKSTHSSPVSPGCFVPSGTPLRIDSSEDYESLTVRIRPEGLKSKLSALIGESAETPEFDYMAPLKDAPMASLRMSILELAREMNQVGTQFQTPVLAELAQKTMIRFLLFHKHNYSEKLLREAACPSEKQLRRIEDYIAANWREPLEIEKLAAIFNMSARTICRLFAKRRGFSPSQLIKRLRLEHARILLLTGEHEATVLDAASSCGFYSFGHFAREYRKAFGERPLDTLRFIRAASYSRDDELGETGSSLDD